MRTYPGPEDLGINPDADRTEDLRSRKDDDPGVAAPRPSEPTLTKKAGPTIMTQQSDCKHCSVPTDSGDVCTFCKTYTPPTDDQSDDLLDWHGHHALWCTDNDDPHDDRAPWCERMVGGVDAVTEPTGAKAQLWVSNIRAFIHGKFTMAEHEGLEKRRNGIQLAFLVKLAGQWDETLINVSSGDARTLAAQLIAAADINDGINRIARRG